ncbi:MAG: AAA family ATPase, partial [Planctomycetes bacterium]|nr:AAA family ATPase [Planctomycetota bacterium]
NTNYDNHDNHDNNNNDNDNENITTIKKVVKPIKIQNTKTNTDETNINTTKTKKIAHKSNNPMLQMAMPFSMMFFNVANKSNKRNINSDDHDDNEDDEEDLHDLDCECDECDEDCDEYEEDEDDEMDEFFDYMNKIKTLKAKIPEMKINEDLKEKFLNILKSSNLDDKRLEWFDTLTKIPFGEYSKYNVDINDYNMTREYIKNVFTNLNSSVWGMYDVKEEILNYVAQCITQPDSKPRVLALCGQPGIGKTKIVRDGISKSLDRPMKCFSMGGIKDSSTFLGFDYTYVGSKYGAIVQALIDCKTMNPVLFFDELDKISDTKEGQDIENFLIHLTDPVQNYDFNDKYFNGIPIDLSKSLLIFSFNNIENISPILKDRLHII